MYLIVFVFTKQRRNTKQNKKKAVVSLQNNQTNPLKLSTYIREKGRTTE
jgi:hypothetical protein